MTAKMLSHNSIFRTKTRKTHRLAFIFVIAGFSGLVWSQGRPDDELNDKGKGSAEAAWQLPAPPAADNLLRFYASPTTGQSFGIDAKSLTVDPDGVIRYTMVSTSSSGAKNISYEGIRCRSHEKKLYALGHEDGTWALARNTGWEPIAAKGANLQHATLADYYFCRDELGAGNAERILNNIRYRRTPAPQ